MPKIIDYSSPQLGAQTPQVRSTAGLQLPGSFGQVFKDVGSIAGQYGEIQYQQKVQDEAASLHADFAQAESDAVDEIAKRTKDGTINASEIQDEIDMSLDELGDKVETREGRNFYERQKAALRARVAKLSIAGEAEFRANKMVASLGSATQTRANQALTNPKMLDDLLAADAAGIDQQVSAGSISQEQALKLKAESGKDLVTGAVYGTIWQNPAEALRMLNSGALDKYPINKKDLIERAQQELKGRGEKFDKLLLLKDKNPWEFLQKSGESKGARQLSIGENAGQSFRDRAEFVDRMSKKHGMNTPFLSEAEAFHFTKAFSDASPDEAVQVFVNLDRTVEDRHKALFARQVFEKDPAIGAALMIAADSPADAKKIVAGRNLLRNQGTGSGKAIKPPKSGDIEEAFQAYVGNSIEDASARVAAREAIEAHMVQSMFEKGSTDFEFNKTEFQKSAEAVLGPSIDMGDQQTLSFRGKSGKFLDEDDFEDLVDGLDDDTILKFQGDLPRAMSGERMNWKKSRGRISLKPVADGVYYVIRDGEQVAVDKDGRPFRLDLKKIERGLPKKKGLLTKAKEFFTNEAKADE